MKTQLTIRQGYAEVWPGINAVGVGSLGIIQEAAGIQWSPQIPMSLKVAIRLLLDLEDNLLTG